MNIQRIIVELNADVDTLDELLRPLIDSDQVEVIQVLTHTDTKLPSLVEGWVGSSKLLNEYIHKREKHETLD